jgi:hypothetical protein
METTSATSTQTETIAANCAYYAAKPDVAATALRLCADLLLDRATFFGTKNDGAVRLLLVNSGIDVAMAERRYAYLIRK